MEATNRGLCEGLRTTKDANLTRCPPSSSALVVREGRCWERKVDHSPYEAQLYGQGVDDWPTMGSLGAHVW
jgi:hypothetical protein